MIFSILVAQESSLGYWGLFWPGVIASVFLLVMIGCLYCSIDTVDSWLSKNRGYRIILTVGFVVVVPAAAAVLFDIANLSEIAEGKLDNRDPWLITAGSLLAIIYCGGQWISYIHTDKWDKRLKRESMLKEEARKGRAFLMRLNNMILGVVGLKLLEVEKLANDSEPEGLDIARLRAAVDPERQIFEMVQGVFGLYRAELSQVNDDARLRIALFRREDDNLRVQYCWDGTVPDCLRSPKEQPERFHISEHTRFNCLAVNALTSGELKVVPDASVAAGDREHPFNFFRNSQQDEIRSIVAMPLRFASGNRRVDYVLMMDTDELDFFNDEKRELFFQTVSENLAHRLYYERQMSRLFQDGSNGAE